MHRPDRKARLGDVHDLAMAMPHVTVLHGPAGNPIYQVGGKSFIFFRTARPDATDLETGERYDDVIVFWVPTDSDKHALVHDPSTPFFTTSHFNGHRSVLLRGQHIGQLTRGELTEIIQDAWLSRASTRRAADWLTANGQEEVHPTPSPRRKSPTSPRGVATRTRSASTPQKSSGTTARDESRGAD
jgi:hypothetical protein